MNSAVRSVKAVDYRWRCVNDTKHLDTDTKIKNSKRKYVKMKKIVEKGGRVVQYNPKKKMIPRGKNPQSQSNAS